MKRLISSRRLQPQVLLIIICAFAGACAVLLEDGLYPGVAAPSALDPAFALLWLVGAACAIGAALNAKYHRLAALDHDERHRAGHLRHVCMGVGA